LKRLGKWSTLPPMSILKKMAELYKPQPPLPTPIKLYHRTTATAAKAIRAKGFRDGVGTYGMTQLFRGVWLSNEPLTINEGAKGDTLLCVTLKCK
jgi:hypothetical protein